MLTMKDMMIDLHEVSDSHLRRNHITRQRILDNIIYLRHRDDGCAQIDRHINRLNYKD